MKRFFSALGKGLLFAAIMVLLQFLISLVGTLIYSFQIGMQGFAGGGLSLEETQELIARFSSEYSNLFLIIANGLTLLIVLVIFLARKRSVFREISWVKAPFGRIWPAILMGVSMAFFISTLLGILPIPQSEWSKYLQLTEGMFDGSLWLAFFSIVIVAPITEEVIFRGLVYDRFRKGMPLVLALLLESALFAVIHGTPIWMGYAFLLAFVMTVLFECCGSLWANILFHMVFNYVGSYLLPRVAYPNDIAYCATLALAFVVSAACFILMIRRRNRVKYLRPASPAAPAIPVAEASGAFADNPADAAAAPDALVDNPVDAGWGRGEQPVENPGAAPEEAAPSAEASGAAVDNPVDAGWGWGEQPVQNPGAAPEEAPPAEAAPILLGAVPGGPVDSGEKEEDFVEKYVDYVKSEEEAGEEA